MISFLRRIRKKLMEQHKIRTYAFYAIGEILLVVIGILIALQVNNWNLDRIERNEEMVYLNRLLEEVERDSSSLNNSIELTEYKVIQAERLLGIIKNQSTLSDSAEFVRDVFLVGRGGSFRPYLPAYQELISTGELDIIQNDSITELITRYIYRVEGMESFVYKEGEARRSDYMKHVHTYFSAMIMDYIWEKRTFKSSEITNLKKFGIDIEKYRTDPMSIYHLQNVAALNMELNRLYTQNMNTYSKPILQALRHEIKTPGK